MEEIQLIFLLFIFLTYVCHGFHLTPLACNVSLSDSCPASLYYVPGQPKTINETASFFHLDPHFVSQTIDSFIVSVSCSCPADHDGFIWPIDYTVQPGDTWEKVSSIFGSLLLEKPEKKLIPLQTVTLDLLCGCSKGLHIVTYSVKAGDTLFTICSRFKADVNSTAELNKLENAALIHAGDVIFIPTTGLEELIVHDDNDSKARKTLKRPFHLILGTVAAAALSLVLVVFILWMWYHKKKGWSRLEASGGGFKSSTSSGPSLPIRTNKSISLVDLHSSSKDSQSSSIAFFNPDKATVFSYFEVRDATANFRASKMLGQGSYGSVYLGRLGGTDVAIKQMKNSKSKEFLAELNILCKVHHTNLIGLIGYAAGGDSLFLVYEYAQNGALSEHLHIPAIKGYTPLSWTTRVQIALDAAKGLEYIHMHAKSFYVHRDVKTSNILLDARFRAKIADFGLVKLLERSPEIGAATSKIVGTFGYLAPEYVLHGCVTSKIDVYAYGVVLMELITGKPALSKSVTAENAENSEHRSLIAFMLSALGDEHDPIEQLVKWVDPKLTHYHKESVLQMSLLAKECVDDDQNQRPDMSKVVLRLSHILEWSLQWEVQGHSHPPITVNKNVR